MRAMVINEFGGPERFGRVRVDEPVLPPGHVLIRVAASSVNPIDCKIRQGLAPAISPDFPAVLHGDVAGVIEAVGEGVTDLAAGDEVYACAGGLKGHGGALAELMVADAQLVAAKPASLSLLDAAALPLVGITAWEALIDRAGVGPGQRVLVHGGAGGVGHVGLQLARGAGAIVCTTVSNEAKAEAARTLGADGVINYREQSVEDYVEQYTGSEGFDVVFDTVGGANLVTSFAAARPGGTVVSVQARVTADLALMHSRGLTLHVVFMLLPMLTGVGKAHHGEILRRLARLVDGGRIRPLFDPEVFPFTRVGEAHAKLEAGRAIGKIRLRSDLAEGSG